MIPLRILGAKVLVALEPTATAIEPTTGMNYHDKGRSGSIILAQPTDMYDSDEHSRGMVMALGEKTTAAFDVALGDVVLFSPAAGISLGEQDDGLTYVLLLETDIQAVILEKASA